MSDTLNNQKPQENPQAGASELNTLLCALVDNWKKQAYEWSENEYLKDMVKYPYEIEIRIAQLKTCTYEVEQLFR